MSVLYCNPFRFANESHLQSTSKSRLKFKASGGMTGADLCISISSSANSISPSRWFLPPGTPSVLHSTLRPSSLMLSLHSRCGGGTHLERISTGKYFRLECWRWMSTVYLHLSEMVYKQPKITTAYVCIKMVALNSNSSTLPSSRNSLMSLADYLHQIHNLAPHKADQS
jgi:hypothetical protein